jgi:hypothetical protein
MTAVLPPDLDPAPPFTDEDLDDLFAWNDLGIDLPDEDDPNAWQLMSPPGAVLHPELAQRIQQTHRWSIADDRGAEWAMRRYALLAAEIAEAESMAKEWKAQVDAWLAGRKRPLERRLSFFESHLKAYLLRLRAEDPAQKSRKLPSGNLTSRLVPAGTEVADEGYFLAWAKRWAPKAVRVKESPVADEVRKLVTWSTVWVPTDGWPAHPAVTRGQDGRLYAIDLDNPSSWPDTTDGMVEQTIPLYFTGDTRDMPVLVPGVTEVPETISVTVKPAGGK